MSGVGFNVFKQFILSCQINRGLRSHDYLFPPGQDVQVLMHPLDRQEHQGGQVESLVGHQEYLGVHHARDQDGLVRGQGREPVQAAVDQDGQAGLGGQDGQAVRQGVQLQSGFRDCQGYLS